MRTADDPVSAANASRSRVFAIDPDMPVTSLETMQEDVARSLGQRRELLYAVASFAALALLLAVVCVCGLMAYAVAQRTSEFGIRQAICATRRNILAMVLRQSLRIGAVGIVAGAAAAVLATRLITTMLYALRATDPWAFVGAALLFCAVSLTAGYFPARRVTRVDPVTALRQ
jgi:putative ABC transport system permease protein